MKIALAQVRPARSARESVEVAVEAVERAAGCAVICFPECYVPGYRGLGYDVGPPDAAWLEHAWRAVAEAARRARVAVILGTERVVDGTLLASALVVDGDGQRLGFQDKVQIDPSEEGTYGQGASRQVFAIEGLTFGVVICHEGWRYPETVRWAARGGAQIVFHPHFHPPEAGSYVPLSFGDPLNTFHEKAMLCRAAENTCFFASVNCAIAGSPTTSAVVRPDGTLICWQPYGVEGLLVADVDLREASGLLAARCRS